MVSATIMLMLFASELRLFLTTKVAHELTVDSSRGERIQINLDVTFPALPCSIISLDVMDISGEQHLDVHGHHIFKRRLSPEGKELEVGVKEDKVGKDAHAEAEGEHDAHDAAHHHGEGGDEGENGTEVKPAYCGPCYGAEETPGECCNTCDEVREMYRKRGWAFSFPEIIEQCKREGFTEKLKAQQGEGCNIYGYLEVNKVAGNFHFAPGKSFQQGNVHVHDLLPFKDMTLNVSHVINKLSFGADFPGVVNPLDGVARFEENSSGMFQYFIKVVPTIYRKLGDDELKTNQFSVTEHFKAINKQAGQSLPGVFFFYDLSPIKVQFTESRGTFLHFVTNVCAIVGGVFTVSGIVDSFVYHGHKAIKKKLEIGKLS